MSRIYTKREIAYLLGCSVSTIEKDCDHLNIFPTRGDRGANLYSQKDFNLLSQLREHCKDKTKSRDSFVPNTEVEVLDIEPTVSKLQVNRKGHSYVRIQSQLNSYYEEAINFGFQQNPLFDLDLLQKISDRNYLLPANKIAPIFGITPKSLNRHNKYYYCGFIATKKLYARGQAIWEIKKLETQSSQ